ncbi:MAG: hypothetical protein K2X87_02910 [Gemmataceae bacterium]|nr:hypothetical protein [Gemmataceae bacterium]
MTTPDVCSVCRPKLVHHPLHHRAGAFEYRRREPAVAQHPEAVVLGAVPDEHLLEADPLEVLRDGRVALPQLVLDDEREALAAQGRVAEGRGDVGVPRHDPAVELLRPVHGVFGPYPFEQRVKRRDRFTIGEVERRRNGVGHEGSLA